MPLSFYARIRFGCGIYFFMQGQLYTHKKQQQQQLNVEVRMAFLFVSTMLAINCVWNHIYNLISWRTYLNPKHNENLSLHPTVCIAAARMASMALVAFRTFSSALAFSFSNLTTSSSKHLSTSCCSLATRRLCSSSSLFN